MEALLRVGAAAINAGQPLVAEMLWRPLDEGDRLSQLLRDEVGPAVTVGEHTLSLTTQETGDRVTVDGSVCTIDDLTLDELIAGIDVLAAESPQHSPDFEGLDQLAASLSTEVSIIRFRLLIEDALFDPRARAVAMDRLEQLSSRHHHRERDVVGLFDA